MGSGEIEPCADDILGSSGGTSKFMKSGLETMGLEIFVGKIWDALKVELA